MSAPDSTAVRVALWRALHVLLDAAPHVFSDLAGLELAAPDEGWRARGDMHPQGTSRFRASIVARSRFSEDLLAERVAAGVRQYVLLGAGLDTFLRRHPEMGTVEVFEIDQPGPQTWKRARLAELGWGVPANLHLVPVDFEAGASWWDELAAAGFDPSAPAVVVSAGVSMYLTREANLATLRQLRALAPGSAVVMSFMIPAELLPEGDRRDLEFAVAGARASGTPFVSFFTPDEAIALAAEAGFARAEVVSGDALNERYYAGRTDGLATSNAEQLLVVVI